MNEAWMWYVAGERRKELLREVADDRLVREARHPGSHPASDWDGATSGGVAGRVVDLVWRLGHAGGLPGTLVRRPAGQRVEVEIDRRWPR